MFRMKSRHSSGFTSVPVAIMSTVTAMRGLNELRNSASRSSGFLPVVLEVIFWQKSLPWPNSSRMIFDDVVGVEVGLGEDQGLGDFGAAGEDLGEQPVPEGADHQPDLVLGHHVPVELVGRVGQVVVEFLVASSSGCAGRGAARTTPGSLASVAPSLVILVSMRYTS